MLYFCQHQKQDHMDSETRRNLEEQLAIHKRNLHALEMQKAQHGITPPLNVLNGIDHEQREIAALEALLVGRAAPHARVDPPPAEPVRVGVGVDYQLGLQSLKAALPDAALGDFLLISARLRENIDTERRYGSTETTRSGRAQIVEELNKLALRHLSRSFNDLCQPGQPVPVPAPPNAPRPDRRDVLNPFGITGRIDDPAKVFGRDALLRRLFEELGKSSNCALIGESGVGKSTLLSMVRKLGPSRLGLPQEAFIALDMRLIRSENDFFRVLCKRLKIESLRGYDLIDELAGQRAIVCLDNIEQMTKAHFTGEEREELRGLADGEDAPLKLVIASAQPLAKLFPDTPTISSPLANLCLALRVPPFIPATVREFISLRLAGTGVAFAEAEIADLIATTGGNPARVQSEAARLFDQHREALE
jgi:hypothetical protein